MNTGTLSDRITGKPLLSFLYTVTIHIRNADIVGHAIVYFFASRFLLSLPLYFPQGIICTFFSFFLIYGGLGVGVLGLGFLNDFFLGRGFQWMGHPNSSINLIMLPTILQAANLKLRLGHWQSLNSGFALVVRNNSIPQVDI